VAQYPENKVIERKDDIRWYDNIQPKNEKTTNNLLLMGVIITIIIIGAVFIRYINDPITIISGICMFISMSVFFFTIYNYNKKVRNPISIGIAKNGLNFRYLKDDERFVSWEEIQDIRIHGPAISGLYHGIVVKLYGSIDENTFMYQPVCYKVRKAFEEQRAAPALTRLTSQALL
jgi:hypothetical protein